MIKAVRCDQASFHDIEFTAGLNVVMAERMDAATGKDSRNGLGKSTLIDIIRFCLGGTPRSGLGIFATKVIGWTYSLDMVIQGQELTVWRNTGDPKTVTVVGTFDWATGEVATEAKADPSVTEDSAGRIASITAKTGNVPDLFSEGLNSLEYNDPTNSSAQIHLKTEEWRAFLGKALFDLQPDDSRNYVPTFASLISYVVRADKNSYVTPFEHHRKQLEWDRQVNNAFLLSLAWEDASDLQETKDEKKDLDARTVALAQQIKGDPRRLLGQMVANRVQLQQKLDQEQAQLRLFRVHPRYSEINETVNRRTEEIHALVNANVADRQIIEMYRTTGDEDGPEPGALTQLYEEAGVIFSEAIRRRLSDVQEFHRQVVLNRKQFLSGEIERLERLVSDRQREIETRSEDRASNMKIFQTHGALSEYNSLQRLAFEAQQNLATLESQISSIQGLEQRKSQYRIELARLQERMRADYEARSAQRQRAIAVFNSNSELIYDVQGTLIIDVTATQFKFDVIIKRDGSDGIGNMKVFCYDLMLAEIWSSKPKSPSFLIHDSLIFDGVDERQVKNALELAANTSNDQGFQYICTINSDNVPWNEFSTDFNFNQYIRLTLTDDSEEGGLLGVRF